MPTTHKKQRRRSKRDEFRGKPQGQAAALGLDPPSAFLSGYDGANFTERRGNVWMTTNTRHELDSFSRSEISRRIHWLYINVGFFRGFINNGADLIGTQMPQPQNSDEEWCVLAKQRFHDIAGTAEAFDVAGKFDYHDAQLMLSRGHLKDGDVITALTESESGAGRVAFYEAHQLESPEKAGPGWDDGVYSQRGRHLAYGIRDNESGKTAVFSSRDIIYLGEFDCPGHHRAVPKMAHAVNHSLDITEIWADWKSGVKTSALFGAVIERPGTATQPAPKAGLPGTLGTATAPDGSTFSRSQVWGDGTAISRLNPGETMKVVTDGRPHQNQQDLVENLMLDMATGYGLPLEVIWKMFRLTGPGVRFVMDRAGIWIKQRQKLLRRWCRRIWVYIIAKEIKAGRLRMPKDGRWWAVKFIAQRNLTIDRSKESRQRQDAIDQALGTYEDWYEEFDGADWRTKLRQRVIEEKFLMAECEEHEVPYERVVRARQGTASSSSPATDPKHKPKPKPAASPPVNEDDDEEIDDDED